MGPETYDAMVVDLDGVVTDTASVHAAAWKQLFDDYLAARAERTGEPFVPFEPDDYRRHVDGKPRYDGVRDFLAARGITLPEGEPADPPDRETVCGLGNRKDAAFNERLARDGVSVFDTTVEVLRRARRARMGVALFSSSRNTRQVLHRAGLEDLFDAIVDGVDAEELGLPGKPHPAVPLEAAARIGAKPERTVLVEDAVAGVEAGRRGGFRLVVGVDRTGHGDDLRAHGADVVVTDLVEIEVQDA
ncbi:MAG TPA: beta-phosphoglucomutase family hydrolase [Acidimicrobiales bacterium]